MAAAYVGSLAQRTVSLDFVRLEGLRYDFRDYQTRTSSESHIPSDTCTVVILVPSTL